MLQEEKPILQNKKTRRNIRSGNTIKYEVNSIRLTTQPTTLFIEDLKNTSTTGFYESFSINKNKGWEELERIKEDPKFFIREQFHFVKSSTHEYEDFLKFKCEKVIVDLTNDQDSFEIIQGRKGKTIKKKREIKGKKGVKKIENSEEKNKFEKVEFICFIDPVEPLKGRAFQSGNSENFYLKRNYGNRNKTFRRRREVQNMCQL